MLMRCRFEGATASPHLRDIPKLPPRAILMLAPRDSRGTGRAPDKLALLRNHVLFRELPSPVLEHLGTYMKRRAVPRGTVIFAKGDAGTGLMGVLSGSVKISVASTEGRDIILNIIHAGEIFGEMALLDGHPRSADATAISDCELMVLERREFVPFLQSQPEVMLKLLEILCSRVRRTSDQLQDLSFLSLPIRLAKTLLQLAAVAETSVPKGKMAITQRELSEIVGRSRESTNKQLRHWAKLGWIRLHWGGITLLLPDKLAEVAAEGVELDPS
jgi:CRP/FNR family cyclic AMP-dependent transcriptional regulator